MAFTDRPTETSGIFEIRSKVGGIDQQFLWNTTDIDARSTEIPFFSDGNVSAVRGGHSAGPHASRARADGEEIIIVFSHAESPFPLDGAL